MVESAERQYVTGGIYREIGRSNGWSLPGAPAAAGPIPMSRMGQR